jgi:hypothetical protein
VTSLSTARRSWWPTLWILRKSVQFFRCAHKDSMCIHIFIGVSTHTYINIYIYIVFLKKSIPLQHYPWFTTVEWNDTARQDLSYMEISCLKKRQLILLHSNIYRLTRLELTFLKRRGEKSLTGTIIGLLFIKRLSTVPTFANELIVRWLALAAWFQMSVWGFKTGHHRFQWNSQKSA